jgi:hypothetical protein
MNLVHILSTYFFTVHSNIFIHIRLGLPNGIFPSGFQTKTSHAFFISSVLATFPAYLVLDFITSYEAPVQPLATYTVLDLHSLLSTLFSNTLSLCSSFNVRDQVPHPYEITDKILAL